MLFLASERVPELAMVGRTVTFLDVCPLHPAELAYARGHGTAAMLERFAERGVDPRAVEPERAPVV